MEGKKVFFGFFLLIGKNILLFKEKKKVFITFMTLLPIMEPLFFLNKHFPNLVNSVTMRINLLGYFTDFRLLK